MKIFLGILEADVLSKLSSHSGGENGNAVMEGLHSKVTEIDPRRLAAGEIDEILCIAEVLCWLGRRFKYINDEGDGLEDEADDLEEGAQVEDVRNQSHLLEERSRVTARPRHESSDSIDFWGSPSTHSSTTGNKDSIWSEEQSSSFSKAQTTVDAQSSYEFDPDATFNDDIASGPHSSPSTQAGGTGHSSSRHIDDAPSSDINHVHGHFPVEESLSLCNCSATADGDSICNCSVDFDIPTQPPRSRRSGSLSSIDFEREIDSFERSQNTTTRHNERAAVSTGRPSAGLLVSSF